LTEAFTLEELIRQLNSRPGMDGYPADFVARFIDGRGPLNHRIQLPTNPDLMMRNGYERIAPLPLDSLIYGDYLLLQWSSHEPSLELFELQNLSEAKDRVLAPAGLLNCWTDDQVVFLSGKIKEFVIRYIDRHGILKIFRKDAPERVQDDDDYGVVYYSDVTLEWAD